METLRKSVIICIWSKRLSVFKSGFIPGGGLVVRAPTDFIKSELWWCKVVHGGAWWCKFCLRRIISFPHSFVANESTWIMLPHSFIIDTAVTVGTLSWVWEEINRNLAMIPYFSLLFHLIIVSVKKNCQTISF